MKRFIESRWSPYCLVAFFILNGVYTAADLSPTQDEGLHYLGGLSYWQFHDYRIQPENGNFPQRLIALPGWLGGDRIPEEAGEKFSRSSQAWLSTAIFYDYGNDGLRWLYCGRLMVLLAACCLGLGIYGIVLRLWGRAAALFALALFVASPTVMAHATLATSDMVFCAVALFFIYQFSLWLVHARWRHALWAGLLLGLAAACKYSVVLLLPMVLSLVLLRMVALVLSERRVWRKLLCRLLGGGLLMLVLSYGVLWSCYGFRYEMFHADKAEGAQAMIDKELLLVQCGGLEPVLRAFMQHRLLPEPYLHGLAMVKAFSVNRQSFFMGKVRLGGVRSFFPTLFLFKSTVFELLLLVLIALLLGLRAWRWAGGKRCLECPCYLPLALGLTAVSLAFFAISSNLNIGHRHILFLYPLLFIFSGMLVWRVRESSRWWKRWSGLALLGLLSGQTVVGWSQVGHQLAYFNVLAGDAWAVKNIAVDSSLDWGQDMKRLGRWLDEPRQGEEAAPVHYVLFTPSEPSAYGVYDRKLFLFGGRNCSEFTDFHQIEPGWYCVSATLLMGPYNLTPRPWTAAHTVQLRQLREDMAKAAEGVEGRMDVFLDNLGFLYPEGSAPILFRRFVSLQWERLRLHLLQKMPVDVVGDSIFVFYLNEEDLAQADMLGYTGYPGGLQ